MVDWVVGEWGNWGIGSKVGKAVPVGRVEVAKWRCIGEWKTRSTLCFVVVAFVVVVAIDRCMVGAVLEDRQTDRQTKQM